LVGEFPCFSQKIPLKVGVILFNAIKDEVPKGGGKESKLFVTGALLYSAILLSAAWLGR
jgi:hypothetical protein